MISRKPNLWNLYQHYRRLSKSGSGADEWAFSFFQGVLDKEKLDAYSKHFFQV